MMNEQITLSPELEARVHQAVENFMQGYGCCQSVVAAFADLYGLDDEIILQRVFLQIPRHGCASRW